MTYLNNDAEGRKQIAKSALTTGFVGYTRVNAEKHYSDDVVARANIAMLNNWFCTPPPDNGVSLSPELTDDG